MHKTAALVVTTIVAATTLAGCGGDSAYCVSVKESRSTLDSFGSKRTNADFATYRRTTQALAKLAPEDSQKDWSALSKALGGVLNAQKKVGLKLESVSATSVARLTAEQSKSLDDAYGAFNRAVAKHGKRVRADVKSECGLQLQ